MLRAASASTRRAVPARRVRGRRGAVPWWFAAGGLVAYALVVLYPNVAASLSAFTDWAGAGTDIRFIGVDNFVRLFREPEAISALGNTLLIAAAVTIIQTVAGLALAIALNQPLKSRTFLRGLFFLPVLLPPVVVAFLWQFLLNPTGPVNQVLRSVGLDALAQNWLAESRWALPSVVVVLVWQNVGITMLVYLAGLQSIPPELLEAGAIDGATGWQRFRFVMLPMLAPATTIVLSVTLISSLKVFDQVFAMTGGGPGYATQTMSLLMYREAFVSQEYGYSTAIALVLTMVILALALVQFRGLRRAEVD